MLQHRKLIELITAIVEQSFDQFRLDGPSRLVDRFSDRLLELAAGQIGTRYCVALTASDRPWK